MYIALAFVLGFICALIFHVVLHKEMLAVMHEMELKYARLLNIVQEWQKHI